MQVLAIKCDRCGHVEEQGKTVRVKLLNDIYKYEQKEFDLCQYCANEKCTKDKQFMGEL